MEIHWNGGFQAGREPIRTTGAEGQVGIRAWDLDCFLVWMVGYEEDYIRRRMLK